jgi:hypothetical protein
MKYIFIPLAILGLLINIVLDLAIRASSTRPGGIVLRAITLPAQLFCYLAIVCWPCGRECPFEPFALWWVKAFKPTTKRRS